MILIGERINAGFKDIARAIREHDPEPIVKWAEKQAAAGADYLDVNIGAASRDPEDMAWLVEVVQGAVPTPISVDSNRPEVIKAGLEALDGRAALVNSTTADDDKLEAIVPLAAGAGAGIIGVAMDARGSPQDVAQRVENGAKIFAACIDAGIPPDRIFLDPVLMPIRFMQEQAVKVLEVIREYTLLSDPPPHISVGLSNICSQTKERSLLTRTFLVMAMAAGLDAAICNVMDKELLAAAAAAEVILNKEIYSDDFLRVWALRRSKGGE
ncbi:TPA: methyltetrahydrofolate--corrinoid methyltransferase [Candidatus Bipolaricaulota bacterium]|nr:methyltetrahydrofolate--corrinoid methyltransferase [Candidatus Bipolaricaulota bacterium]